MRCPKCKSEKNVKSGHHLGRQRYRCKDCGCQFTQDHPKGKSIEKKCLAIVLYVNGLSFRAIARIVKVSPKSVFDWVKAFGLESYTKPKSQESMDVDPNEIWRIVDGKTGLKKNFIALQINQTTGDVEAVAIKP